LKNLLIKNNTFAKVFTQTIESVVEQKKKGTLSYQKEIKGLGELFELASFSSSTYQYKIPMQDGKIITNVLYSSEFMKRLNPKE